VKKKLNIVKQKNIMTLVALIKIYQIYITISVKIIIIMIYVIIILLKLLIREKWKELKKRI